MSIPQNTSIASPITTYPRSSTVCFRNLLQFGHVNMSYRVLFTIRLNYIYSSGTGSRSVKQPGRHSALPARLHKVGSLLYGWQANRIHPNLCLSGSVRRILGRQYYMGCSPTPPLCPQPASYACVGKFLWEPGFLVGVDTGYTRTTPYKSLIPKRHNLCLGAIAFTLIQCNTKSPCCKRPHRRVSAHSMSSGFTQV